MGANRVRHRFQTDDGLHGSWRHSDLSRVGGGGRDDPRAGLRPPLELHVQFSRMQLLQRLNDAGMPEKELNRLG